MQSEFVSCHFFDVVFSVLNLERFPWLFSGRFWLHFRKFDAMRWFCLGRCWCWTMFLGHTLPGGTIPTFLAQQLQVVLLLQQFYLKWKEECHKMKITIHLIWWLSTRATLFRFHQCPSSEDAIHLEQRVATFTPYEQQLKKSTPLQFVKSPRKIEELEDDTVYILYIYVDILP